jgi:hypothetical protein
VNEVVVRDSIQERGREEVEVEVGERAKRKEGRLTSNDGVGNNERL